jgi:hypothetical protein
VEPKVSGPRDFPSYPAAAPLTTEAAGGQCLECGLTRANRPVGEDIYKCVYRCRICGERIRRRGSNPHRRIIEQVPEGGNQINPADQTSRRGAANQPVRMRKERGAVRVGDSGAPRNRLEGRQQHGGVGRGEHFVENQAPGVFANKDRRRGTNHRVGVGQDR